MNDVVLEASCLGNLTTPKVKITQILQVGWSLQVHHRMNVSYHIELVCPGSSNKTYDDRNELLSVWLIHQ